MMKLVIIAIGVVITLIVIGIIKITNKNDFSDEYEIDFEKNIKEILSTDLKQIILILKITLTSLHKRGFFYSPFFIY